MDDYITVYLSRVNTDPSGALRSELGATEREKTAEIVCYFTVKKKKKKDFFFSINNIPDLAKSARVYVCMCVCVSERQTDRQTDRWAGGVSNWFVMSFQRHRVISGREGRGVFFMQ